MRHRAPKMSTMQVLAKAHAQTECSGTATALGCTPHGLPLTQDLHVSRILHVDLLSEHAFADVRKPHILRLLTLQSYSSSERIMATVKACHEKYRTGPYTCGQPHAVPSCVSAQLAKQYPTTMNMVIQFHPLTADLRILDSTANPQK